MMILYLLPYVPEDICSSANIKFKWETVWAARRVEVLTPPTTTLTMSYSNALKYTNRFQLLSLIH
jgi:hypothetical protein